jgi:hypothetical protein
MAEETTKPALTLPPVTGENVANYVEKFIKLRDKIKEIEEGHKEQLKPFKEMLLTLNNMLLDHLNNSGGDNISVKGIGTFYKSVKTTASIADGDAFRRHVIGSEAWDLLDWRANSTAVKQFIEDHNQPPPGVNISSVVSAGVRRA